MTENKSNLTVKVQLIQAEVQKVNKGGMNNFNKYAYARLGDVLEAIRPYLKEYKLLIIQSHKLVQCGLEQTDEANYSVASVICVTQLINSETGEQISIETPGFAWDKNGDKAMYKAITGSRKYGITSLFGLDWDTIDPEDDSEDEPPAPRAAAKKFNSKGKVF